MTEQRIPVRPHRVTVAGVMAAGACVLLVITLFDAMAGVRSAETHDAIDKFLSEPPGDGLALGVGTVVNLLRAVVLFSGALAAAGTVLAVYTLRRHRGARIGLTVVAVLLMFSATFVAGLLPVVVAVAVTMLWSREARDWFDGRAPRPAEAHAGDGSAGSRPSVTGWPGGPPEPAPSPHPAVRPFGAPPEATSPEARPSAGRAPAAGPPAAWAPAVHAAQQRVGRPTTVTVAVWLTWVFAALMAFAFGLVVLVMLAARSQLLEALQRDPTIAQLNPSSQQILAVLWVVSAVVIFWSLAAIALAVLAFRRVNAARIALVVSAAVSGALCVSFIGVGWPHALAAFTTLGLLVGGSANRWYAHHDGPAPQRPPSAPSGPPTARRPKPPVW